MSRRHPLILLKNDRKIVIKDTSRKNKSCHHDDAKKSFLTFVVACLQLLSCHVVCPRGIRLAFGDFQLQIGDLGSGARVCERHEVRKLHSVDSCGGQSMHQLRTESNRCIGG